MVLGAHRVRTPFWAHNRSTASVHSAAVGSRCLDYWSDVNQKMIREMKPRLSSTKRGALTKRSWLHGKVGMQGHCAATIFSDCNPKLPCTRGAQWPVNFSPVLCPSRPLEAIYQEESLWECKWILPGARTLRRNILLIGSRGHTGPASGNTNSWHTFERLRKCTDCTTVNTRKGDLRH